MDDARQDRKAAIAERVTPLSPELQQLELRKHILSDLNDGLMDLTEEAIQATAVVRTTHEHIIALPGANAFCVHMGSLTRSRKRLGRMEACNLSETPVSQLEPSKHDRDIEEERRYREAVGQDLPWWRRLLGGGR
jgi:hypothetical protein